MENELFGTFHLIMTAVSAVLIVLGGIFSTKLSMKQWFKVLLIVGIISETIKVVTYSVRNENLYGGYLPKGDLPFQLCSIQLIFIALLNFAKSEKLHRTLMGFMIPTCLVGGIAALVLSTWSSRNVPVITVQYYLYHIVIIIFAIYLLRQKEIKWEFKDYVNTLALLAFIALIVIYLNSMVYDVVGTTVDADGKIIEVEMVNRVNFMYLIDPPSEGLPYLNKDHGWLVYFVHYALLAVFVVTCFYVKPIIEKIKSLKNKEEVTA